jgi:hypothetical protein
MRTQGPRGEGAKPGVIRRIFDLAAGPSPYRGRIRARKTACSTHGACGWAWYTHDPAGRRFVSRVWA